MKKLIKLFIQVYLSEGCFKAQQRYYARNAIRQTCILSTIDARIKNSYNGQIRCKEEEHLVTKVPK